MNKAKHHMGRILIYLQLMVLTAVFSAASTGTIYFYNKDHQGNIRNVVNREDGSVTEATHYYPFGKIFKEYRSIVDIREKYTGHEYEREAELYYAKARFYDPEFGIWLTFDPFDQFASPFSYCGGNPICSKDPSGLSTWINEDNTVIDVVDDDDPAIIMTRSDGTNILVGESFYFDAAIDGGIPFEVGDIIYLDYDVTSMVYDYAQLGEALYTDIDVGIQSLPGGFFDIKSSGHPMSFMDSKGGYSFGGAYGTPRDIGNALAGLNARLAGVDFKTFQRMAGAIHGKNKITALLRLPRAYTGKERGGPRDLNSFLSGNPVYWG